MNKPYLILMRHGESLWNKANRFTGWVDIPLSSKGIEEAIRGGRAMAHLPIDIIFTSTLIRAQMTAFLAMSVHNSDSIPFIVHEEASLEKEWGTIYSSQAMENLIPVYCSSALNERMYGTLQGRNKQEVAKEYGEIQFKLWRRSFDTPPPSGESLAMTAARTIPYFEKHIIPHLKNYKNVFIAAHGNSLRALIMFVDGLSTDEVSQLEIPTGVPLLYTYTQQSFHKETSLV